MDAAERVGTFGELLRRYRAAAGLTQEELAARTGLTPQGISLLERGVCFGAALGVTETDRLRLIRPIRRCLSESW